jgi:threonine dehydratase
MIITSQSVECMNASLSNLQTEIEEGAMKKNHRLSLERITEALALIDPVFLNSPQFLVEGLSRKLGCQIVVKVETLNPIRSFKGRGTEYFMKTLEGKPQLVCATAGNFGQGMAYSARKRGLGLTIFTSKNANPKKIERMRDLGAEVRQEGMDVDASHEAAVAFAQQSGARMVEDGVEHAISEGAGTIGSELMKWPAPFDAIVIPLGDGALLSGVALWFKAHHPSTEIIGVCASGAPAMAHSWRAGKVVETEIVETIADGIAVRVPFLEAITDMTGLVDDILLVEDEVFIQAMRLAFDALGIVLEPAGAAALAALLTHPERFRGKLVATILTGGNVAPRLLKEIFVGE